ncbi:SANT/Myb domain [Dillenia turbinata]|uniref:SANT/Myb domain n=1 Tax=Dillenia turbinata TaxID=194707 RepID=A0AAN8WF63_9MAGN
MGRKCSHCGNVGHNSRTCTSYRRCGAGLRLFGVHLDIASASNVMKKSFSMDCLSSSCSPSPSSSLSSSRLSIDECSDKSSIGYLSDGLIGGNQERKKGVPWTEEEHRTFLIGLEKLGKGDWRGISRNFVTTRTPTQVASHAQKYFLRQTSLNKKKRRSSLFDMVSSSKAGDHHVHSSYSIKPESFPSPYPNVPSSHHEVCHDSTHCIDFKSFEHDIRLGKQEIESSQLPLHHRTSAVHPITRTIPPSAGVDLELKLATPKPLDQNKSPNALHIGPISVT